jgi:hypothetical protein
MPLRSKYPPPAETPDSGDVESGVRRALGLGSAGQGQKRRFAKDGDVSVTTMRGRREHGAHPADAHGTTMSASPDREAAAASLKAERDARERAERSLVAAQASIRDLQTKFGHMTLERDELRAAIRQAEADKLSAETAMGAERDARKDADDRLQQQTARKALAERPAADAPSVAPAEPIAKARPGRPRKSEPKAGEAASTVVKRQAKSYTPKQKPVKWWIKT